MKLSNQKCLVPSRGKIIINHQFLRHGVMNCKEKINQQYFGNFSGFDET